MMAAFCALVRTINQRVPASKSKVLVKVLTELESLHKEIVLEMIDDSDGLHLFGSVHLESLYDRISTKMDSVALKELESLFNKMQDNW